MKGTARALMNTPAVQRLRRIRQLGLASVVYPSAVHTRFEHVLGAYELARRAIASMEERGELVGVSREHQHLVALAAELHDVGHFVGAHLAEEFGLSGVCHEAAAEDWLVADQIGEALAASGIPDAAERIARLIRHDAEQPLGELVSGPCDVDKMDYIARDAHHCGLPLGFSRDALLDALVLVEDPDTGRLRVGLHERGLVAFEQMLYAKFNLYRSVYFHPNVRAATVMMRSLIVGAIEAGLLDVDELRMWTDEELFILMRSRAMRRRRSPGERARITELTGRLLNRDLFRPLVTLPLSSAPDLTPAMVSVAEQRITEELGLEPGDALVDVPRRPTMLSTDIPVRRSNGTVVNARDFGPDDGFALNAAASSFYNASGRWTLFVGRGVTVPVAAARQILESAVHAALDATPS